MTPKLTLTSGRSLYKPDRVTLKTSITLILYLQLLGLKLKGRHDRPSSLQVEGFSPRRLQANSEDSGRVSPQRLQANSEDLGRGWRPRQSAPALAAQGPSQLCSSTRHTSFPTQTPTPNPQPRTLLTCATLHRGASQLRQKGR